MAALGWSGVAFSTNDSGIRHGARHSKGGQRRDRRPAKKLRWAASVASSKTVAAVVALARADRRHAVETDQFDRDPWILNAEEEKQ